MLTRLGQGLRGRRSVYSVVSATFDFTTGTTPTDITYTLLANQQTYRDASYAWQVAGANTIPFDYDAYGNCLGMRRDPVRTNKTNHTNFAPSDIGGITAVSGDGIASVVSDAANLAEAKLDGALFTAMQNGNVVVLTGGTGGTTYRISLDAGSINAQSWRALIATTATGDHGTIGQSDGSGAQSINHSTADLYTEYQTENIAPNASTRYLQLSVLAGKTVHLCGVQYEEGAFLSYPIPTSGSAGAMRSLAVCQVSGLDQKKYFSDSEGALVGEFVFDHLNGFDEQAAMTVQEGAGLSNALGMSVASGAAQARGRDVIASVENQGADVHRPIEGRRFPMAVNWKGGESWAVAGPMRYEKVMRASGPSGLNRLSIGSLPASAGMSGWVRTVKIYNKFRTLSQLGADMFPATRTYKAVVSAGQDNKHGFFRSAVESLNSGETSALALMDSCWGPRVSLPSGFDRWSPNFNIYGSGVGGYFTDFDPETVKPPGIEKFVAVDGSDSTGNGSIGNPYATITKAIANGATVVNIRSGVYGRTHFAAGFNPGADIALIAYDGPASVIMGRFEQGLSWTQEISPNDSVYKTSRSSVRHIIDLSAAGRSDTLVDGTTATPVPLTKVASVAACQATAGSWYQSGSDLFVHTHDSRVPDGDVLVSLIENNFSITNDIAFYMEGIELWGDSLARFIASGPNSGIFTAYRCGFRFSESTVNLVNLDNIAYAYLIACKASDHGTADGFNYHNSDVSSPSMKILEVDCEAWRCGNSGASNDNCSTTHDDVTIIRLNGVYGTAYGPVIADTEGVHSLCLGVEARNSLTGVTLSNTGFQSSLVGASGNTKMWLKDCKAGGSTYDSIQSTGGEIYNLGGFVGEAGQDHGTIDTDSVIVTDHENWLINAAMDGSYALKVNDPLDDNWWYDDVSAAFGPRMDAFEAMVGAFGVSNIVAIDWDQGEADTGSSAGSLQSAYEAIFGRIRTLLGGTQPVMITNIGRRSDVDDAGYNAVREAYRAVVAAQSYAHFAPEKTALALADAEHLSDTAYGAQAVVLMRKMMDVLGKVVVGPVDGPVMAGALRAGTSVSVTLSHPYGMTDFTPVSGIEGFKFFDDTTEIAIINAVRSDANTITLTLEGIPSGVETLYYGYGALHGVTPGNLVLGDDAHALPLQTEKIIL